MSQNRAGLGPAVLLACSSFAAAACSGPRGGRTLGDPAATAPQRNDRATVPGGRVRFTATDDATGRELPVRVIVRGVDGTPDPVLGPAYRAAGAQTLVIAASGEGEIVLSPGHYSIAFSHGPEWTVDRTRIEITDTQGARVNGSLHHVIPMDDWTACDFHVHAAPSGDSQVSIVDRVASLVAEGVEFATPTEHNTVGDYTQGVRALPPPASAEHGGPGLAWVPAVEVTTHGDRFGAGHFNVYPFVRDPRAEHGGPPDAEQTPSEIFRAARTNNPDAIIQVNHPRMSDLGYFNRMQLDARTGRANSPLYDAGYDALEVFNGFYLGSPGDVDIVLRDWMSLLVAGARYIGTANSDSHVIAYNEAGYPRTYVLTPGSVDSAPESTVLLRSLREGHAFGTSGPMLLVRAGDAQPGATVRVPGNTVTLQIRVLAAPWIDVTRVEIYRDGQLTTTLPVAASRSVTRLDQALTVTATAPRSFFVVVARGDEPLEIVLPTMNARPFAFTNPVWVETTSETSPAP